VRPASPPFLDLYAAGSVAADDIEDFIDAWHESGASEERTLAQLLGMSDDEYIVWLASRKALPLIVAARRDRRGLAEMVAEHLASLQRDNRAADQAAVHVLSHWLSQQRASP